MFTEADICRAVCQPQRSDRNRPSLPSVCHGPVRSEDSAHQGRRRTYERCQLATVMLARNHLAFPSSPPRKNSPSLEGSGMVLLASPIPRPQWHHELFSRFYRAHGCVQQTHRQTHRPRYICSNRPHDTHTDVSSSYSSLDWVLSHWAYFTVHRFVFICVYSVFLFSAAYML